MIPERLAQALADRYRIERELGQGGMATVYLAEDLKHDRKVAIKVLKPDLAAVLGAERFITEIKTTAALSHPHVLPLFDSGTAGQGGSGGSGSEFLYYVMPYIEGETIRDRLTREGQFGIEEAVRITREVADALDYAHRHGVIHRDVKPENILLHDGRPMVMDFGIALAVSAAAGGRMTETGLSLGTPHYMSPEQATADKQITARSDVYSLASVLYEMLAGEPPHSGGSAQAIIMKIVTDVPRPVSDLRKSVPPNVVAALARALEKVPADRFESAAAFAGALADPAFRGAAGVPTAGGALAAGPRWPLVWGLGAATVLLAAALVWTRTGMQVVAPTISLHAFLSDTAFPSVGNPGIAISPDGQTVLLTRSDLPGSLLLRRAGDPGFRTVDGAPGMAEPRVSPDGQFVVFRPPQSGARLHRMPLIGGPVTILADSAEVAGWCDDGSLLVATRRSAILRFREAGGTSVPLVEVDSIRIQRPSALPDCRGVLFTDNGGGNGRLLLLDLRTGAVAQLAEQGNGPRYVPSGHILYWSERPSPSLMAVPFDLGERRVTGPPVLLIPRIGSWDISRDGTLVYFEARGGADAEQLAWVDLSGRPTPLPITLTDFEEPRLSPDGRRIAVLDFNARTLVLYEISTGATTRLAGPAQSLNWEWAPDGRSIYLSTGQEVLRVRADGTGLVDTLYRGEGRVFSVARDTTRVVLGVQAPGQGWNIVILRLDGATPTLEPYLHANWDERQPALSPDGRWLAYVSDESGDSEVYLRTFPIPGDAVRISDGGGSGPAWASNGVLFYEGPEAMMRAELAERGAALTVRSLTRLFASDGLEGTAVGAFQLRNLSRRWDVANGGDRFLMVRSSEEVLSGGIRPMVITNFFEEIRRRTVMP